MCLVEVFVAVLLIYVFFGTFLPYLYTLHIVTVKLLIDLQYVFRDDARKMCATLPSSVYFWIDPKDDASARCFMGFEVRVKSKLPALTRKNQEISTSD